MRNLDIKPYNSAYRDHVLQVVVDAWTPVFEKTQHDVPQFVYQNFYPHGWKNRQLEEVENLLDSEPDTLWVAFLNSNPAGFVGLKLHPEDNMGEIYIIAVAPKYQRNGVGASLIKYAEEEIRQAGMAMVMVETIGDEGHLPARKTYEAQGYEHWPVARYFKEL